MYSYRKADEGTFVQVTWKDYQQKTSLSREVFLEHRDHLQTHYAQGGLYLGEAYQQAGEQYYLEGLVQRHYGIRSSMVVPLEMETADEGACVLLLSSRQPYGFTQGQFTLVEGLAKQIALVLEKLLADEQVLVTNETLMRRERENGLKLSLINALSLEKDWEQKCRKAIGLLQTYVPFDYVIVGLANEPQTGRAYGFNRVGPEEYQTIRTEDFLRMTSLSVEQYKKLLEPVQDQAPLLLNGASFTAHCNQFPLKKVIARTFRLASNLVLPLPLGRGGKFLLSFYSRNPGTYQAGHLSLLERLQDTLVLTLDKLLAYEEIENLSEQLKQENTYLQEEVQT
jgi:GAF domain-containing protein